MCVLCACWLNNTGSFICACNTQRGWRSQWLLVGPTLPRLSVNISTQRRGQLCRVQPSWPWNTGQCQRRQHHQGVAVETPTPTAANHSGLSWPWWQRGQSLTSHDVFIIQPSWLWYTRLNSGGLWWWPWYTSGLMRLLTMTHCMQVATGHSPAMIKFLDFTPTHATVAIRNEMNVCFSFFARFESTLNSSIVSYGLIIDTQRTLYTGLWLTLIPQQC